MLSRIEEIKLLALCAAVDNRQAFGKLVEEYQDSLFKFLYSLTLGNVSLSEDLAQETFLKAYLSIRSFEGISRFRTWLFRIAYNEYISWMRKNGLKEIDSVLPEETQDNCLDRIDIRHDLQNGLKSLPASQRAVVLLFYMEDKSIKEISKITEMPVGTVKVYLSRARKKLLEFLDEYN